MSPEDIFLRDEPADSAREEEEESYDPPDLDQREWIVAVFGFDASTGRWFCRCGIR
jgi:hypothetical protein